MRDSLTLQAAPELIFGLVAPIGVDLGLVSSVLSHVLHEVSYEAREFRLTTLMREVPINQEIVESPYIQSYRDKIAYANEVRRQLGDDGLAALAISAIRAFRDEEWAKKVSRDTEIEGAIDTLTNGIIPKSRSEEPLPSQAYIIRQFKRPEEISLLRSVYGRQFIVVSAYSSTEVRLRRIEEHERRTRGGLVQDSECHSLAYNLIDQDSRESLDVHGQNLRDAFPLGDVFIDATSRTSCEETLRRFVRLLFGNNHITPTHDEYGMYMAKSASLRSSDLSRQVGAAIFRPTGEIVALGCNEVPKAGGGTYWVGDSIDQRDFVAGYDPNDQKKVELLVDIIDRLKTGGHLSKEIFGDKSAHDICRILLDDKSSTGIKESRIMDIIEFGRIIHAEMSAITDAARTGAAVSGATLYCTTFPCHICAKHIVSSGIQRVVYLEPYPKSYAHALHGDSISVDKPLPGFVNFHTFIGVSPYRYRDLFEKGKRKYSGGMAQEWNLGQIRPMIEVYLPSYFDAEAYVSASILGRMRTVTPTPSTDGPTAPTPRASS